MAFDRNGNVSLTNPGSVTPEAPTSYIAAVNMGAPGAIGGTTPAAGTFTTLTGTTLTVSTTSTFTGAATFSSTVAHSDDVTWATTKKALFRDSALYINSSTDGQLDIDADVELEITAPTVDINASTLVDISNALTVGGLITATLGLDFTSAAATATSDGTTTGTIAAGQTFVTAANGGDANNIIVLPAPSVGHIVLIKTTGALELRSSTPASISINGGTGASAESALPANCLAILVCVSSTAWLGLQIASNGTVGGIEAAA